MPDNIWKFVGFILMVIAALLLVFAYLPVIFGKNCDSKGDDKYESKDLDDMIKKNGRD